MTKFGKGREPKSRIDRGSCATDLIESHQEPSGNQEKAAAGALADQEYWKGMYASKIDSHTGASSVLASKFLGTKIIRFLRGGGYANHLTFKTLDEFLPCREDWRVLEIGSAPGHQLIKLWKRYGYEPYGVEYTEPGVEINREIFRQQGLNPENVIFCDLFDDRFIESHREKFNVVCSFGFIEHFDDPREAVLNHLKLLAPNGILLVSIPNICGVNLHLTRFFHRRILRIHNLEIMNRSVFRQLFSDLPLQTLYCDYLGPFTVKIQNTPPGSWKKWLLEAAAIAEIPFDIAFRAYGVVGVPGKQSFSPTLLYVGKAEALGV